MQPAGLPKPTFPGGGTCFAEGCHNPVREQRHFCRLCWRRVPMKLKADLSRFAKVGAELHLHPSKAYLIALARARQILAEHAAADARARRTIEAHVTRQA